MTRAERGLQVLELHLKTPALYVALVQRAHETGSDAGDRDDSQLLMRWMVRICCRPAFTSIRLLRDVMGLDIKEMLEVVRTESGKYAEWFTRSLGSPSFIAGKAVEWGRVDAGSDSNQFFIVLAVSAVIGATIGAVIPGRSPLKDRFTIFVVVLIAWYFVGLLLHGVVRILGGRGTAGTTVRSMMQLLALVYVISNVVGLLVTSAASLLPAFSALLSSLDLDKPGTIIIGAQFLLLLVYLPLTIRSAHGFRGVVAGCAAGLFGAVCATAMASLLIAQGSC